ncbi:MAG: MBL fold metallo-hydrolase [Candidatus Latescibacteria bacterium]|nr:MBL fold metallo-hydrolase [Candidatus Latescibacterota bacterium]
MKITFLAHASFLIETANKVRIITDPYQAGCYNNALGYQPINEPADIVLVSHDHADHNCLTDVSGNPKVINAPGDWTVQDIKITGINSYHDTEKGAARGKNIVFVIETDGLRIVHLGDLGHGLAESDYEKIRPVNVLLSPVGGFFTIDSKVATEMLNCLKPDITIPMHYKTSVLDFPIAKVEEFIKDKKNVKQINNSQIELSKDTLPKTPEIWVLKMARE